MGGPIKCSSVALKHKIGEVSISFGDVNEMVSSEQGSETHQTFVSFLNSVSETGRKILRESSRQTLECSKSRVIVMRGCDAT